MTYSTLKKIETVLIVMGFIGFLIVLGAIGTDDYYTEIGQYYPLINVIKTAIPGILLMVPGIIFGHFYGDVLQDNCEESDWEDEEDEEGEEDEYYD